MPDGSSHVEFKVVEIHVLPTERQQLTHAETSAPSQQCQRSFSDAKLAEQQLDLPQIENLWNALPLRALPNEFDWVSIDPLVSHRVCEQRVHQVPNLGLGSSRPLNAVEPFLDRNGFDMIQRLIAP